MFMVACEQSSEKKSVMKMVNTALLSNGVWEGRKAVQTNSQSCVIFYKWKKGGYYQLKNFQKINLPNRIHCSKAALLNIFMSQFHNNHKPDFCLHHKKSHYSCATGECRHKCVCFVHTNWSWIPNTDKKKTTWIKFLPSVWGR